MTGEESLAYRRRCPYDAMGDYTVFLDSDKGKGNQTDLVRLSIFCRSSLTSSFDGM